ncbi:hypothetical protein RZO55_25060 [Clostridium boliviensis]|uniref:Uncharacterized protein n=1 Tax=Clostridium boliviensis TaxID=318465 RepID=A0ABU4GT81_9CLOT|nr:hypothetical protein [Clostridium boliviensis]MDW2800846.1 hypothetical protein [Clostridium boliviensis]
MPNKIKKPLSAISMMVVIGLLTCGFAYAKANPDSLQFVGKNNTEITLYTDKKDLMQNGLATDNEDPNLEIGQVIVSNGVKEIVYAIGADGSYITIPASE